MRSVERRVRRLTVNVSAKSEVSLGFATKVRDGLGREENVN